VLSGPGQERIGRPQSLEEEVPVVGTQVGHDCGERQPAPHVGQPFGEGRSGDLDPVQHPMEPLERTRVVLGSERRGVGLDVGPPADLELVLPKDDRFDTAVELDDRRVRLVGEPTSQLDLPARAEPTERGDPSDGVARQHPRHDPVGVAQDDRLIRRETQRGGERSSAGERALQLGLLHPTSLAVPPPLLELGVGGRLSADAPAAWGRQGPVDDLVRALAGADEASLPLRLALFGTTDPELVARAVDELVAESLAPIAAVEFLRSGVGLVLGAVLDDGRAVVVKVHRARVTAARLAAVQRVQHALADGGLPGTSTAGRTEASRIRRRHHRGAAPRRPGGRTLHPGARGHRRRSGPLHRRSQPHRARTGRRARSLDALGRRASLGGTARAALRLRRDERWRRMDR